MNSERFQTVKRIVAGALDLPEDQWAAYLARECGGDAAMAAEVRNLLLFDGGGNIETIRVGDLDTSARIGQQISGYTIREILGEGGMGIVYLANQEHPLQRLVALKVIKVGMDTAEVVARFDSERQALALMDHPHIARVFDAGATPDGRPFFVMEYIPGLPITEFCRRHKLGLEDRLRLFVQVCRAIHHAHQRGIIHRDLKPGNILVSGDADNPMAKVIDFGVAKATSQRLTEHTVFTQAGVMIGTPEYMSPEQADPGERDLDVRCDVYTLGVILYELLTGILPINRETLRREGLLRIYQLLQEHEPSPPSTRIIRDRQQGGDSREHGSLPSAWAKRVRGDLDWVTMKALEKRRDFRYGSPGELAEEIERFLRRDPVEAGPPTVRYRMGKFVRKHRAGVTASVMVLAALLLGITGTTVGMIKAHRAERASRFAATTSEAGRLFQLARNTDFQPSRLPILIRTLHLQDRPEFRLEVERCLLKEPPVVRFPPVPDAHNPHFLDVSPDENWLAVGWAAGGAVQLYPLGGGPPRNLLGHRGSLAGVGFLGDSSRLVSAGYDSTVRVWILPEGEQASRWDLEGIPYAFPCRGDSLLVVCEVRNNEPFRWWARSMDGGDPVFLGRTGPRQINALTAPVPAVDPVGQRIVVPIDSLLVTFDLMNLAAGPLDTVGSHHQAVFQAAFSPDGGRIVSIDDTGLLQVWDSGRGEGIPLRTLHSGPNAYWCRFSPDGTKLLVSSTAGYHIWDLQLPTSALPTVLGRGHGWSFDGDMPRDGSWIVTGSAGARLQFWPLMPPRRIDLDPPGGRDGCVAFSPDGRYLVSASNDGTVAAWPLDGRHIGEARILGVFPGHAFFRIAVDDSSRWCFLTCCDSSQGQGTLTRIPLAGGQAEQWSGGSCYFVLDPTGRYAAFNFDPTLTVPHIRILDMESGKLEELDSPGGGAMLVGGFLADGNLLAQDFAGDLGIWSPQGDYLRNLGPSPADFRLAPDRTTMVVHDGQGGWSRGRFDEEFSGAQTLQAQFGSFNEFTMDSTASNLVVTFYSGEMEWLDFSQGTTTRLPLWEEPTLLPAIDPRGRWLASWGENTLTLLPLPLRNRHQNLLHEPYLAWLDSLTNLRMVDDPEQESGYRIVGATIPDWQGLRHR